MTEPKLREDTCAVCGYKICSAVPEGLHSHGGPDLDMRPGGIVRMALPLLVWECPECGYAARFVSDPTVVTREWLQSKNYVTCDGIAFRSALATAFYRQHLIGKEEGDKVTAYYALLHTVWTCDDCGDEENARLCREKAIPLTEELIRDDLDDTRELLLVKADLMRRAGHFEELIKEYSSVTTGNAVWDRILAFQIEKAKEKDTACYRVLDTYN